MDIETLAMLLFGIDSAWQLLDYLESAVNDPGDRFLQAAIEVAEERQPFAVWIARN